MVLSDNKNYDEAGTALGQVTRGRRAQVRAHRGSPSGQGRAIDRSAVMSDLA
jgi:hypothetical protein